MTVFFEYKGKTMEMEMSGGTNYKGGRVTYLSEIKKSCFDDQVVIGFLSDLEKSEHEKFTDVTAHLSRVGDNERNTLTKLEHLGEVEDGFLISLAFYDVASTL